MKIYIAGPFFSDEERQEITKMIAFVRSKHPTAELFIPMEHFIKNGEELPNFIWSKKIFDMDTHAIDECDFMYTLYMGHYSDSGTAWETGYAYAKNIPVILYIPEKNKETTSLMVINSCTDIIKEEKLSKEDFVQK